MEGLKKTFSERIQERGHEPFVLYVSSAVYTGDGSVNQIIFQTEEDAKIDCKIQFENSVAEGKKNGDMESNSGWDEETSSGTIYWYGGDISTFEVKAANYFTVKQTSETLAAEQDFFEVQRRLLKEALIKADVNFFGARCKDADFASRYEEIVANLPSNVFDTYYKTYVLKKQIDELVSVFFNTRNEAVINKLVSEMNAENINECYERYIVNNQEGK